MAKMRNKLDLDAIRAQMIAGVGRQVMAPIIRDLLTEVERLRPFEEKVARVEALCNSKSNFYPWIAVTDIRAALAEPKKLTRQG